MSRCRLPLDCLNIIILGVDLNRCDSKNGEGNIKKYRAMLALPRFALSTLNPITNKWWRIHFTVYYPSLIPNKSYYRWELNNRLHMEELDENGQQLPAQYNNGYTYWAIFGRFHRMDGGPSITSCRVSMWYNHGREHRDKRDALGLLLPSIIYHDFGISQFSLHGERVDRTGKKVT
jgi:hypothetical protein